MSSIYLSPSTLLVDNFDWVQKEETDQDQLVLQHFLPLKWEVICVGEQ